MQHATAPPAPLPRPVSWAEHPSRPPDRAADGAHDSALPVALPVALSFEHFYERSRTRLGRALALALNDVDLAAEAIDEAYARAYERWSTVSAIAQPEGWVYRVAMNWSLSVLRRRKRGHARFFDPSDHHVDPPSATATDPAIDAALDALDAKHRAVVVCRHFLGWSVAETAAALGVRDGTVKSRLHRANSILQAHLSHMQHDPDEELS